MPITPISFSSLPPSPKKNSRVNFNKNKKEEDDDDDNDHKLTKKKIFDRIFYQYQTKGLIGILISYLLLSIKYILRQFHIGPFIPTWTSLYEDKKGNNLRKEAFLSNETKAIKAIAPLIMEEKLINKNDLEIIDKYENEHTCKNQRAEIEKQYLEAKTKQNIIRKQIAQKSEKEIINWFKQNKYEYKDWIIYIINHWSDKSIRNANHFFDTRKSVENPTGRIRKVNWFKKSEIPLDSFGNEITTKEFIVQNTFFDILKDYSNKIYWDNKLTENQKTLIKTKIAFISKFQNTLHPLIETALVAGDAFYNQANLMTKAFSLIAPIATHQIYAIEKDGTHLTKEKQDKLRLSGRIIKDLGGGTKRISEFDFLNIAEMIGLTDLKKYVRDVLEDHTPLKYMLTNLKWENRNTKGLLPLYKKKEGEKVYTKHCIGAALVKGIPFKIAGDFVAYGLGGLIISPLILYLRKLFKKEKEEI